MLQASGINRVIRIHYCIVVWKWSCRPLVHQEQHVGAVLLRREMLRVGEVIPYE